MAILGPEVALRRQRILAQGDSPGPEEPPTPTGPQTPAPRAPAARPGAARPADPGPRTPGRSTSAISPATVGPGDLPSAGRGWVDRLREDRRRDSPAAGAGRGAEAVRPGASARDADPARAALTPGARHALTLVAAAAEHPVPLTGDDGLLTVLVGDVLRRGLEVELEAHLGHGRWASSARGADNIRNGAYSKRVATDLGVVPVQMPRDRRGTFDPVIVPKHGRRLASPGSSLLTIYASGVSRSEMRSTLSTLTQGRLARTTLEALIDDLVPDVRAWQLRRLAATAPVLLLDSVVLVGRGSRAARRLLDVAVAIDSYGACELLGLWRRPSRPTAGHWESLTLELVDRGLLEIEFVCTTRDDLAAAAIEATWPGTRVRAGVESLTENALRAFA